MLSSLYIAWRYIRFHKVKTAILVVSITLILYLPLALRILVAVSEQELMARAASTPLIVGAKGSSLDLAINTLYFEPKPLQPISMAEADRVNATGLAQAIPIYARFRARDYPIIGTTLEYFDYRSLGLAVGRHFVYLGECVVGAAAARELELAPGGSVVSSPENLFDLAGSYPLKMDVVGVLEPVHTPDDFAVFVDVRTAWVIQGLGHGHADLTQVADPTVLLGRDGNTVRANAKLMQYNQITEENRDSFHFHGDTSGFPITAVLPVPPDQKSEDLLRGRYLSDDEPNQILHPIDVIRDLMGTIFKVEGMLNSAFSLIGIATLLLILLVVMLSLRLRQREMATMFKLGCGRTKIAGIVASEIILVACTSVAAAFAMTWATSRYADELLRALVL